MILLMGIPGSGKGTQGKLLSDDLGYTLVSMSDVIRQRMNEERKAKLLAGHLLNDDEIIEMVKEVLAEHVGDTEIIFDGFPRTIPQAQWLVNESKAGRVDLRFTINLVASKEEVLKRMLARGRTDDKKDVILERFKVYHESTFPLIDWLKANKIKVVEINAEGDVEEIHKQILRIVK